MGIQDQFSGPTNQYDHHQKHVVIPTRIDSSNMESLLQDKSAEKSSIEMTSIERKSHEKSPMENLNPDKSKSHDRTDSNISLGIARI